MKVWLLILVFLLSGCIFRDRYSAEEVELNKTNGNRIVAALSQYYADNAVYPPTLSPLVPTYLKALPQNSREQSFYYETRDETNYLLCFNPLKGVPQVEDVCCYHGRHELWDCTEGDE